MGTSLRLFLAVAALSVWAGAAAAAVKVQEVTGATGVTAWLVEDHTNPIITLHFAFRGGAALDPAGKEGLANLAAATMDEGAGDMRSEEFRRKLDDLSISLSYSASLDNFSGTLRTLTENADQAIELQRLSLTRPRFDDDAVERIREQILANLRRESEDPRAIANRELFRTLFPGHPYGRPTDGSLETVPLIKLVDLKDFAAQRLARDNLVIGAVGDVTPERLAKIIDTIFGSLPETAADKRVADTTPTADGRRIVVDKDIPQSVIRFGQSGIKRNDPAFYAAYVMNYVLGGGGFESRLYEEVREKRGLAYSAFSYLAPLDHAGLIMGGAGTANQRAAETLEVVMTEWRRMAENGLTAEELADAKTYLTGSYALRFDSSSRIASMLVGLQLENLGIDYFQRRNGLIEAVTLDQVNAVAKRLLRPENLAFVVVGRPVGLTAE